MNTADPTLDTRIRAFAAAVRDRLADLDPEDVDDLTGGLEADLQEEAADHDGALQLGDPVRYADELRSSAGLPERAVATAATSPLAQLRETVRERLGELHGRIRANRELSATLDLLIVFRPVWWLLRAWAGYQIAVIVLSIFFGSSSSFVVLPGGPVGWILLIPLLVVSVQWGRGEWAARPSLRSFRSAVSVVTALALVVLIPVAIERSSRGDYVDHSSSPSSSYVPQELTLDGKRISNVFAYDAEGNLLDRVQLFDQDGEPLSVVPPALAEVDSSTGEQLEPSTGAWNAFPLSLRDAGRIGHLSVEEMGSGRPPFAKALPLPALKGSTSTPTPSATATPGSTQEEGTPSPTPTPEPTP
ncbi:hypothetical protein QKG38_13980 [Clavibacter michiganensis]|uniref:hypothetical protein n=1 Tax=Clavibacter michiganensis TaxID=28447 RepID=UPI001365CE02|nr:hypothetical protein [Clavibacter michiganensis]MDO4042578.1 hypothetical protein [Clavibacter michiganensis]MDO4045618.1 hypothetical protein [Clavibacter michiganensis]MDO4054775.1 hypothetical protein [Clavibacter michiganensis]MDO4058154.1 hypothetical protein [Clavibacter michiganensis]MDO4060985.1 hypothetical protein [Clavibacter michiganensis]